jgi:hypothetical protein
MDLNKVFLKSLDKGAAAMLNKAFKYGDILGRVNTLERAGKHELTDEKKQENMITQLDETLFEHENHVPYLDLQSFEPRITVITVGIGLLNPSCSISPKRLFQHVLQEVSAGMSGIVSLTMAVNDVLADPTFKSEFKTKEFLAAVSSRMGDTYHDEQASLRSREAKLRKSGSSKDNVHALTTTSV